MSKIITSFSIDMAQNTPLEHIFAKQGDANSRTLKITLLESGLPYIVGERMARLRLLKKDGTQCFNDAKTATGNVVTVELTAQMLAVEGLAVAEIAIYGASSLASSQRFYIEIEPYSLNPPAVTSSDEYKALTAALMRVEEAKTIAETAVAQSLEALERIEEIDVEVDAAVSRADKATTAAITATEAANTAAKAAEAMKTAVDAAIRAANLSTEEAIAAKGAADKAVKDALAAIAAADAATTAAAAATEAATAAANAAQGAKERADAATTATITAKEEAESATERAIAGAERAESAAPIAAEALDIANEAAEQVGNVLTNLATIEAAIGTATGAANNAANTANTAAGAAISAAKTANDTVEELVARVNTAISNAEGATTEANSAATAATKAAEVASASSELAAQALEDAQNASRLAAEALENIANVQAAADAATAAASAATAAATAANTAAANIAEHIKKKDNPHSTTAEQVGAIPVAQKGTAGGVAPLGVDNLVPMSYIPSQFKERRVVNTIAERNAIADKFCNLQVYVKDATADPTVKTGGADYLWDGVSWIKTGEAESMDVVLQWGNVQGKPEEYTAAPHASKHRKGGSDALTAADVGARPDTWTPSAKDVGADEAGSSDSVQVNLNNHVNDAGKHVTEAEKILWNKRLTSVRCTKSDGSSFYCGAFYVQESSKTWILTIFVLDSITVNSYSVIDAPFSGTGISSIQITGVRSGFSSYSDANPTIDKRDNGFGIWYTNVSGPAILRLRIVLK